MMGIYEICNLHDGKATAYVGSSVDIERRWREHRRLLCGGEHYNPRLQHAWDKYGEAAFEWRVIEEAQAGACLLEREQHWLDRYFENPDTCYNVAHCAEAPTLGLKHSEEAKHKIGKAHKGKRGTWYGKQLGEDHKHRIGQAQRGRVFSKEHKEGISKACAKPYPAFIHRETGVVIPAGMDLYSLCRRRKFDRRHMWDVIHGRAKSHRGWKLL